MRKTNESGFHAVELVLVLVVVALVGFVGFKVLGSKRAADNTTVNTAAASSTPEIKSSEDLTAASKTVDDLNTDDDLHDMTELEQELNAL